MNNEEIGSHARLVNDLRALGVGAGDVLLVHSSLRSMGEVEGGADTVIDALLEVLGSEGTLLFPSFTFTPCYTTGFFSYHDTPSCVGKISETFRKRAGVLRSLHPTHSVTAFGKYAGELLAGHERDDTPVGENSPLRKLPAYGGKILMLGCSLRSNSFMHGMEEAADVFYLFRGYQEYRVEDAAGHICMMRVKRHNFVRENGNVYQRYDRSLDVLARGDYSLGSVHGAASVLMKSAPLAEGAVGKMRECPTYFVDDPNRLLAGE